MHTSWLLRLNLLAVLLLGCRGTAPAPPADDCTPATQAASPTQVGLLQRLDPAVLQRLAQANTPDAAGALSRNVAGYFHVRFQMGVSALADFAVATNNAAAADMAIRSLEYSYGYQTAAGDFQFIQPSNLPGTPTAADLASGVAFFLSSVGAATTALSESSWFANDGSTATLRTRLQNLRGGIRASLNYLKQQAGVLQQADARAPNRLIYDAIAYYALGSYLADTAAQNTGLRFAQLALAQQHATGYFIEGSGYDSSYQGVSLALLARLLVILPNTQPLKPQVWRALSCGCQWQATRILPSGEISTAGNSRVYPGGEQFLGQEKQVAYVSTMQGFWAYAIFANNPAFGETAWRIANYYN
jgi:hypothetical protein